jgi:competence protein ComFC
MNHWSGKHLKSLYFKYRQVIFPSRCLLCGRRLLFQNETGVEICDHCCRFITPLRGKRCEICSLPLISEDRVCVRCRDTSYHFKKHHALFQYRGVIKELIYFYKFKQKYSLASLFARFLYNTLSTFFPYYPLIPVPSRKHLLTSKARDHLSPIVHILKKEYKTEIIRCLQRRGDIPQKKLSFEERKKNLKGKINVKKGKNLKHNVLLFDDIFTTGATADECSRILLQNGVENIYVISIAID